MLGEYKVLYEVTCREGPSLASKQTAASPIKPGTDDKPKLINVTEFHDLKNGTTRLKCEEGWISLKEHLVESTYVDPTQAKLEKERKAAKNVRRMSVVERTQAATKVQHPCPTCIRLLVSINLSDPSFPGHGTLRT